MSEEKSEVMRLAVKVASDLSPFGMALGEMLRTLELMDKRVQKTIEQYSSAENTLPGR